MEETFFSRFDVLDARLRKVLQTCAVLGLAFSLSDVVKVHPEMDERVIESSMDDAIDELILVEQVDEDELEDNRSLRSGATGTRDSATVGTRSTRSTDGTRDDRYFQFSHAMWRHNVLSSMLKEHQIEIHRRIAESLEKDATEGPDVTKLLTQFHHWKSCGRFLETARLSIVIGGLLENFDLFWQVWVSKSALAPRINPANVSSLL
jgi:predicted ATPase